MHETTRKASLVWAEDPAVTALWYPARVDIGKQECDPVSWSRPVLMELGLVALGVVAVVIFLLVVDRVPNPMCWQVMVRAQPVAIEELVLALISSLHPDLLSVALQRSSTTAAVVVVRQQRAQRAVDGHQVKAELLGAYLLPWCAEA
jgi:lysylphosphatidylglycerol synthetase-like protein (DUF2156 family)